MSDTPPLRVISYELEVEFDRIHTTLGTGEPSPWEVGVLYYVYTKQFQSFCFRRPDNRYARYFADREFTVTRMKEEGVFA